MKFLIRCMFGVLLVSTLQSVYGMDTSVTADSADLANLPLELVYIILGICMESDTQEACITKLMKLRQVSKQWQEMLTDGFIDSIADVSKLTKQKNFNSETCFFKALKEARYGTAFLIGKLCPQMNKKQALEDLISVKVENGPTRDVLVRGLKILIALGVNVQHTMEYKVTSHRDPLAVFAQKGVVQYHFLTILMCNINQYSKDVAQAHRQWDGLSDETLSSGQELYDGVCVIFDILERKKAFSERDYEPLFCWAIAAGRYDVALKISKNYSHIFQNKYGNYCGLLCYTAANGTHSSLQELIAEFLTKDTCNIVGFFESAVVNRKTEIIKILLSHDAAKNNFDTLLSVLLKASTHDRCVYALLPTILGVNEIIEGTFYRLLSNNGSFLSRDLFRSVCRALLGYPEQSQKSIIVESEQHNFIACMKIYLEKHTCYALDQEFQELLWKQFYTPCFWIHGEDISIETIVKAIFDGEDPVKFPSDGRKFNFLDMIPPKWRFARLHTLADGKNCVIQVAKSTLDKCYKSLLENPDLRNAVIEKYYNVFRYHDEGGNTILHYAKSDNCDQFDLLSIIAQHTHLNVPNIQGDRVIQASNSQLTQGNTQPTYNAFLEAENSARTSRPIPTAQVVTDSSVMQKHKPLQNPPVPGAQQKFMKTKVAYFLGGVTLLIAGYTLYKYWWSQDEDPEDIDEDEENELYESESKLGKIEPVI